MRLYQSPDLRRDLASEAFEKVSRSFLIDGMISKYMDVYIN